MKRWCNNVDWSLENCILNANNDGFKRFGMGTHSWNILKRDISFPRNGRVPFKWVLLGYFLFRNSYFLRNNDRSSSAENNKFLPHLYRGIYATFTRGRSPSSEGTKPNPYNLTPYQISIKTLLLLRFSIIE